MGVCSAKPPPPQVSQFPCQPLAPKKVILPCGFRCLTMVPRQFGATGVVELVCQNGALDIHVTLKLRPCFFFWPPFFFEKKNTVHLRNYDWMSSLGLVLKLLNFLDLFWGRRNCQPGNSLRDLFIPGLEVTSNPWRGHVNLPSQKGHNRTIEKKCEEYVVLFFVKPIPSMGLVYLPYIYHRNQPRSVRKYTMAWILWETPRD